MYTILQLFLLFLSVWGQEEIFYKIKDTRITTDVTNVNGAIISEVDCSSYCLDEPKCLGFNYNNISQECEVLSATRDTTGNKTNSIQWAKVKRTCKDFKDDGYLSDGEYVIDPDGLQRGERPVVAYCNMTGENGRVETHVTHDSQARTHVSGYDDRRSYNRPIQYNMVTAQIVALLDMSDNCKQFIRYECHSSAMALYHSNSFAAWVSREGLTMTYWGGASPGSDKCACGMTASCDDASRGCNCDENDQTWRYDEGYLTDRNTLPVTKLYFGDTGLNSEEGYHTLGPLICYGPQ